MCVTLYRAKFAWKCKNLPPKRPPFISCCTHIHQSCSRICWKAKKEAACNDAIICLKTIGANFACKMASLCANSSYLSMAMARRCRMEAVQQRTSLMVHISHSWVPNVHSVLICVNKSRKCFRVEVTGWVSLCAYVYRAEFAHTTAAWSQWTPLIQSVLDLTMSSADTRSPIWGRWSNKLLASSSHLLHTSAPWWPHLTQSRTTAWTGFRWARTTWRANCLCCPKAPPVPANNPWLCLG